MSGGEESIKRDSKKELMKKRSGTEKPAPPLVRKSRKKADEEEQLAEQPDYSAGDEAGEETLVLVVHEADARLGEYSRAFRADALDPL